MRKLASFLILPLFLAACVTSGATVPGQASLPASQQAVANVVNVISQAVSSTPPRPFAGTTLDDSAVRAAFHALDTAASIIDATIAAKRIVPGSPLALKLRTGLHDTRLALDAAAAAQRAGQAQSYHDLLIQAETAAANMQALLAGR